MIRTSEWYERYAGGTRTARTGCVPFCVPPVIMNASPRAPTTYEFAVGFGRSGTRTGCVPPLFEGVAYRFKPLFFSSEMRNGTRNRKTPTT